MAKSSYCHLTLKQRYKIDALLKAGHKPYFIADQIGVNPSTIYREIKRNRSKRGMYSAEPAHDNAMIRKERFSLHRKFTCQMESFIRDKLTNEQWSPEQISGYCKANSIPMVSHERIYQFIYLDKAQGGGLYKHLRVASRKYRKRYWTNTGKFQRIKGRVSIDHRPDYINNRERIGDWEIDTIIGKDHKGSIVTIAERVTAFALMGKIKSRNSKEVAKTVIQLLAPFKDKVYSITSDNGLEFAMHKYIAEKLQADFYFAHPYSSWERGLNENTNKLIRQYIPKKTNFENITNQYINEIAMKLNRRPRKKLRFKSPGLVFLDTLEHNVALAG